MQNKFTSSESDCIQSSQEKLYPVPQIGWIIQELCHISNEMVRWPLPWISPDLNPIENLRTIWNQTKATGIIDSDEFYK